MKQENQSRSLAMPLALAFLTLAGCASTRRQPRPLAPTVLALPAHGETFATFQQHDATCRRYALSYVGGGDRVPRGAAGAVGGAAVGATAGALLGAASGQAGHGAAIGAGTGLLAGMLVGRVRGRAHAAAVQRSYDMSYAQCMVANGDRVDLPGAPRMVYAVPAPAPAIVVAPGYPPPPPPYPPPYASQ